MKKYKIKSDVTTRLNISSLHFLYNYFLGLNNMILKKQIISFMIIFLVIILFYLIYYFPKDNTFREISYKSYNVIPIDENLNSSYFDVYTCVGYDQIAYGATSSDFNNDDSIDFAISYATGNHSTISIFFNDGKDRYFCDDICIFNYSCIDSLDSGDFDGDGDIDLVFSYSYHNDHLINVCGYVVILINEGNCKFKHGRNIIKVGNETDDINTRHVPRVTSGDYDSDGDIDIITGDMSGKVELFINDGNAVFTSSGDIYDFGYASCGLSSVDFDGDGDIDVIIVASDDENNRYNGNIYVKENINGIDLSDNNTTNIIVNISNFVNSASIASIDYDDDFDVDFIVGIMNQIYLYRNEGKIFNKYLICVLPSSEEGFGDNLTYGGLAVSDFNGDGFADFVAGGSLGNIRLFLNINNL